jgi:hypothetical protein
MNMWDEHLAEEAAKASADTRALALLAAAADPVGTKARVKELSAATAAQDAAAARAEKAAADAKAKSADADAKLAALERREREFLQWKTNTEARLKQADADARAGEAANAQRAAELAAREAALRMDAEKHSRLIARMRAHVAEVDAA